MNRQIAHNLEAIQTLLVSPQKIMITCHNKPDGDAIGASLGLYHYLQKKGHEVKVVVPTAYPEGLHFLDGDETVVVAEESVDEAKAIFEASKIVFCLDFNALYRVKHLGDLINASTDHLKIMIDHHLDPQPFYDYCLWDTKATSTAELVYRFIELMSDQALIDETLATCLYLGIATDTGRFKYGVHGNGIFEVMSVLMNTGIDLTALNERIFDNVTLNEINFLGHALSNLLVFLEEYNTAILAISQEDFKQFDLDAHTYESGALIGRLMSIQGVNCLALLIDRGDLIKISFRSKGNINVNEIAHKYFEGGGHKNASGGRSELTLEETVNKIKMLLPDYEEVL